MLRSRPSSVSMVLAVVGIGHDDAALSGHQIGKTAEGVLHIGQILEEVQMIGLNVQNDRDGGEEGQEGVAVFAALQDDGVSLAHPVAGVPSSGRVPPIMTVGSIWAAMIDMGAHGGGGGLAVGAGDAQGVACSRS